MAVPGVVARIAFGVLPGAGEPLPAEWTDVSEFVKSVHLRYGRSEDLDRIEVSSVTVVLDNEAGVFTPWNTGSAYYPNMRLLTQIEVAFFSDPGSSAFALDAAALDGSGATLFDVAPRGSGVFRGLIDTWLPTFLQTSTAHFVTLTAGDLLQYLQTLYFTGSFDQQTIGARITAVLTAAACPFPTEIDSTGLTVKAESFTNQNVLEYLRSIADLDGGVFYSRGDGRIVFSSRATLDASTELNAVQATIGDASNEINNLSIVPSYDEQFLTNRAIGKTSDGADATPQENETSQSYYLVRQKDFGTTALVNAAELETRMRQEVVGKCDARIRFPDLTFDIRDDDPNAATLVALDLMHRVKINLRPSVGSALSVECLVQGAEHEIDPETWTMTLRVSSTAPHSFILGSAVPGVDSL